MNELQERAYKVLKAECQWRKKLKQYAESEPVSEKHWPQEPQRECVVYDWPEGDVN